MSIIFHLNRTFRSLCFSSGNGRLDDGVITISGHINIHICTSSCYPPLLRLLILGVRSRTFSSRARCRRHSQVPYDGESPLSGGDEVLGPRPSNKFIRNGTQHTAGWDVAMVDAVSRARRNCNLARHMESRGTTTTTRI